MGWCDYTSVQLIKVKNVYLGTIYYMTSVLVLGYIAYTIIDSRSYQANDALVATTSLKMKGSGRIGDGTVYDQYDMVVPAILPDSVFVGTNFVMTPGQQQGECPGISLKHEACNCSKGSVELCCPYEQFTENGMFTGKCSANNVTCEMRGWCPFEVEPEDPDQNIMIGVENWTLFARINGNFPRWNESVANTNSNASMEHPNGITLFSMGGMVKASKNSWDDFKHTGGIILASVEYNCNLDHDAEDCEPDVTFTRLDNPDDPVSSGFNFRFTQTTRREDGTVTRDLWKLYGIYVVFQVFGQGGRFDFITTAINLGAMAAYFSFATVLCDFALQNFLPNKQRLTDEKFRDIDQYKFKRRKVNSGGTPGDDGSEYSNMTEDWDEP